MLTFFQKAKATFLISSLCVAVLLGCAGRLPVPGGGDTVNQSFYTTQDDLLHRLEMTAVGMSEQRVFGILGHGREDFIRMNRDQIVSALYGSNSVGFYDGATTDKESGEFLQSLSGLSLNYKIVEREHGFSSPIRIRTDEQGFDYTVTLVFRDGDLHVLPILTGGIVNKSSSRTFFDYINPSTIMNHTQY